MSIKHPVFCRKVAGGKVIVVTIMDQESFKLSDSDSDTFFLATSSSNIDNKLSCPTIRIDQNSKTDTKKYSEIVEKLAGYKVEDTIGSSIDGILKSPYWFIRKSDNALDDLLA